MACVRKISANPCNVSVASSASKFLSWLHLNGVSRTLDTPVDLMLNLSDVVASSTTIPEMLCDCCAMKGFVLVFSLFSFCHGTKQTEFVSV